MTKESALALQAYGGNKGVHVEILNDQPIDGPVYAVEFGKDGNVRTADFQFAFWKLQEECKNANQTYFARVA